MTKYCLFLDDCRTPEDVFLYTKNSLYLSEKWMIVRNYDQFILAINNYGIPYVLSFDHDLESSHYGHQQGEIPYDQFAEKTGYHCAKWLIDYCINNNKDVPQVVLIHSMNFNGSRNIESLFRTYEKIYRGT
jgi:hypothetical protein